MLVKKNLSIYITRKDISVPDTLYSKGIDVESNDGAIEFCLDFTTNLRDKYDTNQKADAKSLEEDLKNSREPTVLEVNLDTKQSFDAVYKSIKSLIDLRNFEHPVKCFLTLQVSNTYRLGCEVKINEEFKQIRFNITD